MRFPPPLVFLGSALIGFALGRYGSVAPLPLVPALRLWLAATAFVIALCSLGPALFLLVRSGQDPEPWQPSPELILQGAYRFSRNPIYLGMMAAQIAAGLFLDNLWIAALSGLSLFLVHHIAVLPEERYLKHRFGEAYTRYMAAVPRYLFRWGARLKP